MIRRLALFCFAVLTLAILALDVATYLGYGFRRSPSPSLPYRYFLVRWTGAPRVGDYVSFCAPREASLVLKRHGYPPSPRCDPPAVSLLKQVTSIRAGKAHVRGHHPDSYDSRHFGDVPLEELTPLIPLF